LVVINESPNSLKRLRKESFYNEDEIEFISTIGFLYEYLFINEELIQTPILKDMTTYINNIHDEDIIIATDLDDAGNFIALEIIDLLDDSNKIYRYNKNFENLYQYKTIDKDIILKDCITKLNVDSAKRYWQKMNTETLRQEIINYIYNKLETTEGII